MKLFRNNFLCVIVLLLAITSVQAQTVDDVVPQTLAPSKIPTVGSAADSVKPCYWKYSGLYTLQTTQTGYIHWADGGENSLNLSAYANFASTYNKGRWLFDNYITLSYGTTMYADNDVRITDIKKTDDKIDLSMTGGYQIDKSKSDWYYSAMFTLLSQFDNGYDYSVSPAVDADGNYILQNSRKVYPLKSAFFSPATMNLALGATYVYKDKLTILLSPFSGKLIIVADDRLTYKDKVVGYDENNEPILESRSTAGVDAGKHTKWGAGLLAEIRWKQSLNKANTIGVDSKLRLSNNYLDARKSNRWNFDIYGQFNLNFSIAKVITASIRLECAYDDDIMITYQKKGESHTSPIFQFKEIVGIGLAYKLEQKAK